ncbi:MAG TPA: hypothetical protein VK973_09645 [Arenicellales bacterium]|nr:hypothetical protein [Arenicellales bacterium]
MRALYIGIAALISTPVAESLAASAEPENWSYSVTATALQGRRADLDTGGKTRLTGHHFRVDGDRRINDSTKLGVRLYYDIQDREFSGSEGFAALAPWDTTHRLGIAGLIRQKTRWGLSYGIRPYANLSFASGALSEDALSYGAAMAVLAGWSKHRRLGVGVRLSRDITGSESLSPIVLFDWKVNDDWSLSTPREANFTAPAGVEIRYTGREHWRMALATVYDSDEVRLNDDGATPARIGESSGFLTYVRATRRWPWGLVLNGYLGAIINGDLQVNDADGSTVAKSGYDTAPFAAVSIEGNF